MQIKLQKAEALYLNGFRIGSDAALSEISREKMIDRICISINNKCNLACRYCHFHEKGILEDSPMNVYEILDNVMQYAKHDFKIGFVGNGEPFLDIDKLKRYLEYIDGYKWIHVYTITNGTIDLSEEEWGFLEQHKVNVGFSLDGYKQLHNLYRCDSYNKVIENVEKYRTITGHYPTFNATVGKESISNVDRLVDFFSRFDTRITFSRMIGKYGITLDEYRDFMQKAGEKLNVRRGGYDCTMYGGKCGAGINNYFYANGKVYLCGNCIDLPPIADSSTRFEELEKRRLGFNRDMCYKEQI